MTYPKQATYHYSVDGDDLIVSVSNTWLAFARENESPELTSERVLGRSLWSFVAGTETVAIYKLLFQWVRNSRARISVPFRCDSPHQLRFMRLYLTPSEHSQIDMAAILERVVPRSPLRLLERMAQRADYTFEICSFCRKIFAFGAWLEPEEAIGRLGWLEAEDPPRLCEVVCESCQRTCHSRISAPPPA